MREGLFREIMKMTEESTRRNRGMWEEVSMKSRINRMKKIGVVLNAGLIISQVDEIVKGAEVLKQLKVVVAEAGEELEDHQEEEVVDLMEEEEVLIIEDQEEVEASEGVIEVVGEEEIGVAEEEVEEIEGVEDAEGEVDLVEEVVAEDLVENEAKIGHAPVVLIILLGIMNASSVTFLKTVSRVTLHRWKRRRKKLITWLK